MEKHDIQIGDISFSIFKDNDVFGDGMHETTKFMMDLIIKHGMEDKTVLDIGTGTGILSVLCGKLGAKEILAVDLDTHALEYARKNLKYNEVEADVEVNCLADHIENTFDVILANLSAPNQVENVKTITKNMNDEGLFIMSWWNKLKFEDYVRGFEVIDHVVGEEYDGYVLRKRG